MEQGKRHKAAKSIRCIRKGCAFLHFVEMRMTARPLNQAHEEYCRLVRMGSSHKIPGSFAPQTLSNPIEKDLFSKM